MLELLNIHKTFGENHVLNGVNFIFEPGKIYTIIGGNGTGKSTIFNLISGFLRPDIGEIIYNKRKIQSKSSIIINHLGITRTFQDLRLIHNLSVKENILLAFKDNPGEKIFNAILPSCLYRKKSFEFSKRADKILEKINLNKLADNLAGEISYGQQKLLSIGCCIANGADVILLDEPISGIDQENYSRIYNIILELKAEGKTVIQIEHNQKFIEELSDRIYFLYEGKSTCFDDYNKFIINELVKNAYLR